MILLKIFSVPLTSVVFPFSIPITFRFVLFIVSQISWMFFFLARYVLDLTFSLTKVSISSIVSSRSESLSSLSCILLMRLTSEVTA